MKSKLGANLQLDQRTEHHRAAAHQHLEHRGHPARRNAKRARRGAHSPRRRNVGIARPESPESRRRMIAHELMAFVFLMCARLRAISIAFASPPISSTSP